MYEQYLKERLIPLLCSIQPIPKDNFGNNHSFDHFFLHCNCHKLQHSWFITALLFRRFLSAVRFSSAVSEPSAKSETAFRVEL